MKEKFIHIRDDYYGAWFRYHPEIALDVGFGHLGRFSGQYRALYGTMPSTTLRTPTRHAA